MIPDKVKEKLDKVVAKGYIKRTDIKFVKAIMFFFTLPRETTFLWCMRVPSWV